MFTLCHFHRNGLAVSGLTLVRRFSLSKLWLIVIYLSLFRPLTSHINNSMTSIIRAILCIWPITVSIFIFFFSSPSTNINKKIGSRPSLFPFVMRMKKKLEKKEIDQGGKNGRRHSIDFHQQSRNQWPVKNSCDIISTFVIKKKEYFFHIMLFMVSDLTVKDHVVWFPEYMHAGNNLTEAIICYQDMWMVFIRQNNVTNGFSKTMVWKCLWRDKTMANGLNFVKDLLRKCPAEHEDYFTFPAPFFHQNPLQTHVFETREREACVCMYRFIDVSMLLLYYSIALCSRHIFALFHWEGHIYGECTPTEVYIFIELFVLCHC